MRKLLILDGDVSLAESYRDAFRRDGFDVVTATTAAEARDLMRRTSPDLVIMDVRATTEEGVDLLEEVTSRYPDVPLVFYTGADEEMSDRELWLADAVVSKSDNLNELRHTVEEVLRERDFENFDQPRRREPGNRRLLDTEW